MAAATATDVQKAYLAYFGRPADPVGLAYWTGKDAAVMKAGFAASVEYATLYAGMTSSQMVAQVYTNLLGRTAEAAGLLYWSGELAAGRQTVSSLVDSMQTNALGNDITTINNRVTYATAFTAAIDTTAEIVGYNGTAAATAARTAIASVVDTAASLTAAQTALATSISTIISAGTSSAGTTYTLTTSVDAITGTSGNDTVVGTLIGTAVGTGSTVNIADSISLGAGTDTVEILTAAATAFSATILPTLSGVEVLKLKSLNAATSLVGSLTPDMTTLDLNTYSAASAMTVTAATSNLRTINISNSTQDVNDLTVTYNGTGSSTSTDALTFNLSAVNATTDFDVADDALIAIEGAAAGADNGIEQLVFNVTGKNMLEAVTSKENNAGATALNKITVTGSGSLAIGTALVTDTAAVLTVDASTNTGGVTMSVGTTKTTFTGGTGDDVVIFGTAADLDANDTINLGTGNNTIIVADVAISSTTTALNAAINGVTTAGTVGFSAAVTGLDMTKLTAANVLSMNNVGMVITNQAATDTLILKGAGAGRDITANGGIGYTTLNLKLVAADTVAATNQTISASAVATLNIESTSDSTSLTNTLGALTNAAVATITITGNGNLDMGSALAASASVNAASFTGALTVIGSNTASLFTGGSGKDTITGGTGADTIDGGAGNDTINTGIDGAVGTTITGGLGADAITSGHVAASAATIAYNATAAESYATATATGTTSCDTLTVGDLGDTGTTTVTFTTGVTPATQTGSLTATTTAPTIGTTTVSAGGFIVYNSVAEAGGATAPEFMVYQDTDGDGIIEAGEFAVKIVGTTDASDTEAFAVTSGKLVFTLTGA